MFKAIVVGTDGSDTAREAVRQAAGLARLTAAELHIVSAYGGSAAVAAMAGAAGYAPDAYSLTQQKADAESLLDQVLTGVDVTDVRLSVHARQGEPADVLLQTADDVIADLIVVGSRGMTGAKRFFLGSVPNRVAHRAQCAVHIVHTC